MLMKKLFFGLALLFSTGCCLMSCSQDEIMNAESPVTRDYQTDSEILSKFVDFNSLTGEYYLNENKKSTAISYLTDKDWLDLQQVNPVNYEKYVKGLNELNQQLAEYEKDPNITQIVYSTYGKIYVKDLKKDSSIRISKVEKNVPLSRATYQTLTFMQGSTSYASFTAGAKINTAVRIFSTSYYLCELKCNTKGAQCVNNHSSGLVLSGTGSTNTVYTWESGSASTYWDFTGTGRTLAFGSTAQVDFTN
jgi:hypothetical protein